MRYHRLTTSKKLITPLVESLVVGDPPQKLENSSYGFFSLHGVSRRVQCGECALLLGDTPLSLLVPFVANMCVLWQHPSVFVALQSEPTELIERLLANIAGVSVFDRIVPPILWPSVNETAADIWKAPLFILQARSMSLRSLEGLAARFSPRGVVDLYIDSPALLRLCPHKPSMDADLPQICEALRALAHKYQMAVLGAHSSALKLADAAILVDDAIKVEDFGDMARFGFLARGENNPTFVLARRTAQGRYNDVMKVPWTETEKRFEAARNA